MGGHYDFVLFEWGCQACKANNIIEKKFFHVSITLLFNQVKEAQPPLACCCSFLLYPYPFKIKFHSANSAHGLHPPHDHHLATTDACLARWAAGGSVSPLQSRCKYKYEIPPVPSDTSFERVFLDSPPEDQRSTASAT